MNAWHGKQQHHQLPSRRFVAEFQISFLFELLALTLISFFFFFNDPATPEISPFPLHAPLPISTPHKFRFRESADPRCRRARRTGLRQPVPLRPPQTRRAAATERGRRPWNWL